MTGQIGPGPCPRCGSADTKFTTVKPPKVAKRRKPEARTEDEAVATSEQPEAKKKKKKGSGENETAHRCTPACEQTARLCIPCHLVTLLPPDPTGALIPGQRQREAQQA